MVFKSFIKSCGPAPNADTAIEGSTKYLVSDERMDVLDLKLGFQAGISSITKIFFNAFKYDAIVSSFNDSVSFDTISFFNIVFAICAP